MKHLMTLLLLFTVVYTASALYGGKVIQSNWDPYIEFDDDGNMCLEDTDLRIDIYFKLKPNRTIPATCSLYYWISSNDVIINTVALTDFESCTDPGNSCADGRGEREYMLPIYVHQSQLGDDLEFDFEIINTGGLAMANYPGSVFVGYDADLGSGSPAISQLEQPELYEYGSKPICQPVHSNHPWEKNEVLTGPESETLLEEKNSESSNPLYETREGSMFNVFPNPITDQFQINLEMDDTRQLEIKLLDIYGKTLYILRKNNILAGNYKYDIDSAAFPKGVLFCEIRTDQQSQVFKLIKKE